MKNITAKFLLHALLCVALMLVTSFSYAADFVDNGIGYDVVSVKDLQCKVVDVSEYNQKDLIIPSTVPFKGRTFTVVAIGKMRNDCQCISISLPNTISVIEEGAFPQCDYLEKLTIPSSVSEIKEGSFDYCQSLRTIIFERGASPLTLGTRVFSFCPKLTAISIGRNLIFSIYGQHGLIVNDYDEVRCCFPFSASRRLSTIIWRDNVSTMGKLQIKDYVDDTDAISIEKMFNGIFDVSSLRKVVIGKNIKEMKAFNNAKLETIELRAATPIQIRGEFSMYIILNSIVKVPEGSVDLYKNAPQWQSMTIK